MLRTIPQGLVFSPSSSPSLSKNIIFLGAGGSLRFFTELGLFSSSGEGGRGCEVEERLRILSRSSSKSGSELTLVPGIGMSSVNYGTHEMKILIKASLSIGYQV